MTVPVSLWVWALKALQNSMMLIPCCPRAGPTGGAGLACPAFACSLIVVSTFLAIVFQLTLVGEFACLRTCRLRRSRAKPDKDAGSVACCARERPRTQYGAGHR